MNADAVTVVRERADRFEARARRQVNRIIRKLVMIAMALGLAMWAFIAWSQWSDYAVAEAAGRRQESNLTAAASLELTRAFDMVAATLRLIEAGIRALPPDASDAAREQEATRIGQAIATRDTGVRIIRADGHVLYASAPSIATGDAAALAGHRDHRSPALTINPPVGPEGDRRMQVSQRLETADGHFAGVAILLLRPSSLLSLFHLVDLGDRGMATINSLDGIVLAGFDNQHPDGQAGIGVSLRGAPYPEDLKPGAIAVYSRVGRLAPIERLVTVRRLATYPLNVMVALDQDDVMGSARAHATLIGVIGLGAAGLIAILTWLLGREVWRRTKREIELAYDRDKLQTAQAQIQADRARLEATTRELMTSKDAAEAANRARSQFLAHMSHELRTPLHAIIGFSELIQDQAPTRPGSPPIAGYAADIWTSGKHLLELINTILDISKVESGTATLSEMALAIPDIVRNAVVSVKAQAEARNIQIETRVPPASVRIFADRTRLLQVIINLMSNAVKFTPNDGNIELSFAQEPDGALVFSVTDTGIGMTEAEIEIALEPFGQVDNTLARSFEGTGLGLPLARKLTELHGGRLELTSVKGRGTTARVVLPASRLRQRETARVGGG